MTATPDAELIRTPTEGHGPGIAGAGPTILAAMRSGRIGAGVELDPGYCDVAVARWQRVTGDLPRLARGRGKPKAVDLSQEPRACHPR